MSNTYPAKPAQGLGWLNKVTLVHHRPLPTPTARSPRAYCRKRYQKTSSLIPHNALAHPVPVLFDPPDEIRPYHFPPLHAMISLIDADVDTFHKVIAVPDRETGRRGDRETGRRGDGETGRRGARRGEGEREEGRGGEEWDTA